MFGSNRRPASAQAVGREVRIFLLLRRGYSLTIPIVDFIYAPSVSLDGKHHFNRLADRRPQLHTIQVKEPVNKDGRRSLIAANPGMVLDQSEAKRRSLANDISTFQIGRIARTTQGRFDKRAIKDSKTGFPQATHEHNVERDRFGKGEIAYRLNRQSS